jgi:hypothetical protein
MIRPTWANSFTPRATTLRLSGDTPSLAETSPQLGRLSEPASGPLFWQGPLTMFRPVHKLLLRMKASKAIRAVQDARARYLDALQRGDRRDEHRAHKALVDATTARLRLELGR